ncbi:hypothetical protein AB7W79_10850 [Providencia rettgeri]
MTDKTIDETPDDAPTVLDKVAEVSTAIADGTADLFIDLTSSPTSRAGHTVHRVGKMDEAKVPHSVIALQLSENSHTNITYEKSEIPTIVKLYKDSATKVGVTKAQARALIKDQKNK